MRRTVRYYDVHLHLGSPDRAGLDRLLSHLEAHPGLVGGNLVLNSPQELEVVERHGALLPPRIVVVPYVTAAGEPAPACADSGWFKLHPDVAGITATAIPGLARTIAAWPRRPKGLLVHNYPWGERLDRCVGIPLTIALARALPDVPVIATHGGGYEAWALRAHTGSIPNVLYDFSVTLSYFRGSDVLLPLRQYLEKKRERVLFGTDWPSAGPDEQWAENVRLAAAAGLDEPQLEALLLANSRRLWPDHVPAA